MDITISVLGATNLILLALILRLFKWYHELERMFYKFATHHGKIMRAIFD